MYSSFILMWPKIIFMTVQRLDLAKDSSGFLRRMQSFTGLRDYAFLMLNSNAPLNASDS